MEEKWEKIRAGLQHVKAGGGLTPLTTFMMLIGLVRLLQRKGVITPEDLTAEIGLFLDIKTLPPELVAAAESAMLLTDEALLQALFYPTQGNQPGKG